MLAVRVREPVAVDPAADDLAACADEVAEIGGDDVEPGAAGDVVAAVVVLDGDPVVAAARVDPVRAFAPEQDVGTRCPDERGPRGGGRDCRQRHEKENDRDAAPHDPHRSRSGTFTRVTGPRRLSQAISEGDGISLIVAVRDAAAAQRAEEGGAEALLAEDALDAIRASTALPIVTSSGSSGDARIVCPGDEDVELGEGVELVVQVEKEEEMDEALERFDPELFVLAAPDGDDDRLEHVLDLLSDLPAGKLAIADLRDATQPEIDELERAGVDAVLVRELP